ncbi:OmpA family protein [Hymenobacter sp. M29]|uniref:OmpA family protein n=1 Tax=Hymenobacter mellowenesis TaxID=3063995 RepID=A0ABT9AJV3_9BACT|nr:OmpA family protein [Hymenobacter sp. M29]MDO7849664.1 OmpA family protein [Hymenobacter sp. M29]
MAAPHAQAQTADKKTAISGWVSSLQYTGNLGTDFWKLSGVDIEVGGGGGITRYLSPSFDLGVFGNYETYKFSSMIKPGENFEARVGMIDLGLKLKLNNGKILKENSFIQPYLMAGPGLFIANSTGRSTTLGQAAPSTFFRQIRRGEVFGAAGLRFRLSESVFADVQTGYYYPFTDEVDGVVQNEVDSRNDRFLRHQAGITVAFGQMKDEDKDGVSDKKDKCPGTPAGVAVDPNGCPLDKDGDGVPDYQDKCPDVKGVAALQGCPDRDGDGVTDAEDACPDTPGKAELKGCPDADNDGVIDQNDKCPGTPAGVRVDANGCPLDRDGDGVPDYQDRCPDRAGPASNRGCPEIKAEAKKRLQEATKFINFEFNKAVLLPSSYPTLKDLAALMSEYPDYTMSIAGHTDSKGADDYNLRLSYDRAASARTYMLSQGVPADRIESRGYGETKPIADNAKAAGQALNRRVEFDLYLTGEPNSAEVKYGPAPTISELEKTPEGRPTAGKAPVKKAPAKKAPVKKAPVKRK